MKLKAVFGPGENDYHTTNAVKGHSVTELLNMSPTQTLTYTLNNFPLTKKFVSQFLRLRNSFDISKMIFHTNYYPSVTPELLAQARVAMNNTINRLNQLGIPMDTALHLNLTDVMDPELDKLNELHFRFEKEAIDLKSDPNDPNGDPVYVEKYFLLEKVNNLVHFIERTPRVPEEWANVERDSVFNMSVRNNTIEFNSTNYIQLEPIDYLNFSLPCGGDLVADFSTVGKDLNSCFCTNDLELVRRGEVKPQTILTDYIFMHFDNTKRADMYDGRRSFYHWIEQNNLGNYIDTTDAMYTPGRHILGSIDDQIITGKDFYEKIISTTPVFLGYYITNDDGTLIHD
jgi:hypothetical protein